MVADTPEISRGGGLKSTNCNNCTCVRTLRNGESDFNCADNKREQDVTSNFRGRTEISLGVNNVSEQRAVLKEYSSAHLHSISWPFEEWPFSKIEGSNMYEIFRFDYSHTSPIGLCVICLTAMFRRIKSKDVRSNNRLKVYTKTH